MSKFETVCPYCKKTNAVEKSSFVDEHGLQKIQCSHCSKGWATDLSVTDSLTKSAPGASSELAELRVQVRAQLNELTKRINGLLESRAVAARLARFNTTGVEKSDVVTQELEKALANGHPVTSQTFENSAPRFQTVRSAAPGHRVRSQGSVNAQDG